MSHTRIQYICNECGNALMKWQGRCDECNAYGTFVEKEFSSKKKSTIGNADITNLSSSRENGSRERRTSSRCNEFDRVLGGGFVNGAAIIIGGEPGIGKSTFLLQIVAKLEESTKVLYVSGEESVHQIQMRACRLNASNDNINLISDINIENIQEAIIKSNAKFVIIDSIHTIIDSEIGSHPGTISQIKSCSQQLISMAKTQNITIIFVGHITKEGQISGPKMLEHMVDVVLYLEQEQNGHLRILRAMKNRFGPTNEIGIFEMSQLGLQEVKDPSSMLLEENQEESSGVVIFPAIIGNRVILTEIQSLIVPSYMASPRRSVIGWDSNRLAMIIAVLHSKCKIALHDKEIYLNVAGGFKIEETAADLAVAMSLLSTIKNKCISRKCIVCGEIGLSGEIRKIHNLEKRLQEAGQLGFESAVVPRNKIKSEIKTSEMKHISEVSI